MTYIPQATIGHIYVHKDYLVSPLYRKFVGVKTNDGVLHRERTMSSHSEDIFVFETTWARVKIGETTVETFKATREPELRELEEDDYDFHEARTALHGYLVCCCF